MLGLGDILSAALVGSRRAGAAIVKHRVSPGISMQFIEKQGGKGPQTRADLMSQVFLTHQIVSAFPQLEDKIIGEEGKILEDLQKEFLDEGISRFIIFGLEIIVNDFGSRCF